MMAPHIPHASHCANRGSALFQERVTFESAIGKMYERLYGCTACGATVTAKQFDTAEPLQIEAFEVEEEDSE